MKRLFPLVNHCRSEQEHLNNYTDDKGQGNLQMRQDIGAGHGTL
jgi:hypothetical protein